MCTMFFFFFKQDSLLKLNNSKIITVKPISALPQFWHIRLDSQKVLRVHMCVDSLKFIMSYKRYLVRITVIATKLAEKSVERPGIVFSWAQESWTVTGGPRNLLSQSISSFHRGIYKDLLS